MPTLDERISKRVMETLAEESPDAIVVVDVQGRLVWVNGQAERLFGYPRVDLIGRAVEFLLPEGTGDTHRRHRATYMESPRTRRMGVGLELRARQADGATFPVEISLTPLSTDAGDLVIATVRDITDRQAVADEQAALRRVATLVAHGVSPDEILAAVAEEVGRVLGVDYTAISRYEPDSVRTVVAAWARFGLPVVAVGVQERLGGPNVPTLVFETGQPARIDRYGELAGPAAAAAIAAGVRSAVGGPIRVEGQLWGLMNVYSIREEPLPDSVEHRLARFTELVATAISNAEAKAALSASRARLMTTADETRRRIQRDLHDGAQQRLVTLAIQLQRARADVPPELLDLGVDLERVRVGILEALEELQEYSRGIHPVILARGGLGSALRALARRCSIQVDVDSRTDGRLPEAVEVTAYYVVSEALANAVKHANAHQATVRVERDHGVLHVSVHDDGCGGADPSRGTGLVGLQDRVEALGGRISVHSPSGTGTTLEVELPLPDPA